jgi:predicted transcriptional regulator
MAHKVKQLLEKTAREKAPGPAPTFSVLHILRAMELVAEKPIGRTNLAAELNVGQGAARTIINRLREAGLLSTSKMGCKLTTKGLRLWKEYKKVFQKKIEIRENELTHAKHNFAVLAKNCGHKIRSGIEQRDAAVKIGAKGAITIIFRDGRLIIPSVSDNLARDFPATAEKIVRLLQPEENDVVVISGADTLDLAEHGIVAATWTLLDDC